MRCVNIDWLELYCLESLSVYPCNADYFRRLGYWVQEREFGTRQYREMFTLLDQNEEPVLEIRRNPVSATEDSRIKGMFDPCSCHMRFANRFCYRDDCVQVLLNFLYQHQYTVVRIYRLDICLDLSDSTVGMIPKSFSTATSTASIAKSISPTLPCMVKTFGTGVSGTPFLGVPRNRWCQPSSITKRWSCANAMTNRISVTHGWQLAL